MSSFFLSTGTLIRDFHKGYREVRYTSSGSIRLTEIEHNAYRNALTLEITHIGAPRYGNLKTLPANTHYGYVTTFKGTTVTDSISIKYSKFRVFDILNFGVWRYHQNTEIAQLLSYVATESAKGAANGIIESLGEAGADLLCFLVRLIEEVPGSSDAPQWIVDTLGCDPAPPEGASFGERYRAFPVASPFPDVIKFKSDVPCSFLLRLESWFLVNPAVYILDNPSDTGDSTENEEEYPSPETSGEEGFPPSSDADPDSDPRDFDDDNTGYPGGTNQVVVRAELTALSGGCDSATLTFVFEDVVLGDLDGPFEGFENGDPFVCSPNAYLGFRIKAAGQVFGPFATGAGVVSVRLIDVFYN